MERQGMEKRGKEGKKKRVNVSVFACVNTLMQLCIRRQSCTIHDAHVRTSTTIRTWKILFRAKRACRSLVP